MDSLPRNRVWVPDSTEIYTEEGWLPVEIAFKAPPKVMAADLDKRCIVRQQTTAWSRLKFEGKINQMVDGLTKLQFRYAFPIPKQDLLTVRELITTPLFRQINFSGYLYSFDVPLGVVIMRCRIKDDGFAIKTLLEDADTPSEVIEGALLPHEIEVDSPEYEFEATETPDWWLTRTRW